MTIDPRFDRIFMDHSMNWFDDEAQPEPFFMYVSVEHFHNQLACTYAYWLESLIHPAWLDYVTPEPWE